LERPLPRFVEMRRLARGSAAFYFRIPTQLKDAKPDSFASDFDSMQVSAHKDAVSLFERYAKSGDDPKLKDWAGKTLPTLQHHLEMAQDLGKTK
jgi:putative membrane protein